MSAVLAWLGAILDRACLAVVEMVVGKALELWLGLGPDEPWEAQ